MFENVLERTRRAAATKRVELAALREEIQRLRSSIRAIAETLISPGDSASVAEIQARIRLEDRVEQQAGIVARIDDLLNSFAGLADEWSKIEIAKAELPRGNLSQSDEEKFARLQQLIREQLVEYGMTSIDPEEIGLDRNTYRPTHKGFLLSFDLSASDLIRTIWAYTSGLLEVSTEFKTNHLGLLVLDEPKQQDTASESLAAFFRRLARSSSRDQQVLVATSEPSSSLANMVRDLDANVVDFPARIITKKS